MPVWYLRGVTRRFKLRPSTIALAKADPGATAVVLRMAKKKAADRDIDQAVAEYARKKPDV